MQIYESLITHETIKKYTSDLFGDGYYEDAVFKAYKQLEIMVKTKSHPDLQDESGTSLMGHAFSAANPVLKIIDLQSRTERDEQSGFCQLFRGSMEGIRNIGAHANINIDSKRALHLLSLANLLAEVVDQSVHV